MGSISDGTVTDTRGQHVFISYSRADKNIVASIAQHLKDAGVDVWQDSESIPTGRPYRQEIADAVLSCRKMLIVWSRRAAGRDSKWLMFERSLLLDKDPINRENRIVLVLMDGVDPPSDLEPLQAIDYSDANALDRILAACDLHARDDRKPAHDWGSTRLNHPPVGSWGRQQEIKRMRQYVLDEQCRLVTISGMAGVGKTTLVRAFLQERDVRRNFVVFCRELYNPIPVPDLLKQMIAAVSGQSILPRGSAAGDLLTQFLELDVGWPALIVLDNVESAFDPLSEVQRFQSAYADFEILLQRFASDSHRHCLLLTCREALRVLAPWSTSTGPVRDFHLRGVGPDGTREILRSRGDFRADDRDWDALTKRYAGHPTMLQLISNLIAGVHDGNVGEFLAADPPLLDNLAEMFNWHVERLTPDEREVAYWLAVSRQSMPLSELKSDLLGEEMRLRATGVVESLRRKILVEIIDKQFSLQPSIGELMTQRLVNVVTDQLIEKVADEILLTKLDLLNTHSLLKTQSSQHVRTSQRKLILGPILDSVARRLPPGQTLGIKLEEILDVLRRDFPSRASYAPGNILNMLVQLKIDLRGCNFSHLCIWQADLEGATVRGVDFSDCLFARCSFTQTFGTIHAVAFGSEGAVIAAGDTGGSIYVWRLTDRQLLFRIHAHENWVRRLLFISGGRYLVSAGDDHNVCIWDARAGRRLHTLEGHTNWVGDLAFHEPSQVLASASEDGLVRLWSLADLSEPLLLGAIEVAPKGVRSVAFQPDGHQLACGGSDGHLRTLLVSSRHLGSPVRAHDGSVSALTYLPGNLLATGGSDGRLRLWDPAHLESRGELRGSSDEIVAVVAHVSTNRVAAASKDGVVRLWDVSAGRCVQTLQGHTGAVRSIDVSDDGRTLLSGGEDQSVRVWSLADGNCLHQLVGHMQCVWIVAWSPDGQRLASGHDDHCVRIWDAGSGECLATLEGHTLWVQGVAWSPDGKRLASGSADATVRVWDVETRSCVHVLTDHSNWVVSVGWSPDGSLLASGSRDGTVRVWDAWSGRCAAVLRGHQSWVWTVRFGPDGSRLASGGEDHKAILWDVASHRAIGQLEGHRRGVWCLSWSPDGTQLATAGVDGDVCLWDAMGNTLIRRLEGHTAWIGGLDFHPGGKLLASGSADGTVRVWNLNDVAQRHLLSGHESWIWSVAWSPDGERLASGSQDETIRIWRVADGACHILRAPRPYDGTSIRRATGLTDAQRRMLCRLGAIDEQS